MICRYAVPSPNIGLLDTAGVVLLKSLIAWIASALNRSPVGAVVCIDAFSVLDARRMEVFREVFDWELKSVAKLDADGDRAIMLAMFDKTYPDTPLQHVEDALLDWLRIPNSRNAEDLLVEVMRLPKGHCEVSEQGELQMRAVLREACLPCVKGQLAVLSRPLTRQERQFVFVVMDDPLAFDGMVPIRRVPGPDAQSAASMQDVRIESLTGLDICAGPVPEHLEFLFPHNAT